MEEIEIEKFEAEVRAALEGPIAEILARHTSFPPRLRLEVVVHGPQKRVKRTATTKSLKPEKHQFVLRLVPAPEGDEARIETPPAPAAEAVTARAPLSEDLAALVHKLAQVERDPSKTFVGLKWFRDNALPGALRNRSDSRMVLEQAIREGLVTVGKLANPNSPFVTTTIHLHRADPRIAAALLPPPPSALSTEGSPSPKRRHFEPIELPPGVSVSKWIIENRR